MPALPLMDNKNNVLSLSPTETIFWFQQKQDQTLMKCRSADMSVDEIKESTLFLEIGIKVSYPLSWPD